MKKFTLKSLFSVLCLAFLLGGCENADESLDVNSDPGTSFLDVENDGYQVTLAAQAPAEGQLGEWQTYLGTNGSFEDITKASSIFFGEPGETYLIGWEVSDGDRYDASTINVSFKPLKPVIYNTSIDTLQSNISLKLEAETPKFGAQGKWEILSGNGGRIENFENPEAQFIGVQDEEYSIRWTLSYGSKEESLDFSFRTDKLEAQAGADRLDILTSKIGDKFCNLDAFLPAGSTGNWEIIDGEGATVHSTDDPNSLFEGLADSIYTLTWTVQLDQVQAVDTLKLRFRGKWGVWTDPRDEQNYRYVEIDGLEWMAENYNYAYQPGVASWYYGQSERAVMKNGHAVETDEDRKLYGRLYNWYAAYEATPEGWRLPTYDEFEDLVNHFGGPQYATKKIIFGGEAGTDFNYAGYLDIISREDPALRNVFNEQDEIGFFWTADYNPDQEKTSCYLLAPWSEQPGFNLLSAYYFGLSVRYVRDVQ